jgi:hypothetical protein
VQAILDTKPFSGVYPSEFMRDVCQLWIDGEITFEEAERRFTEHRGKNNRVSAIALAGRDGLANPSPR